MLSIYPNCRTSRPQGPQGPSGKDINLNSDIVVITDGNGHLTSSTTTTLNLSSLDTTSSITNQLLAKQPSITGAVTTIVNANLNSNIVPITDVNGKIINSITTPTQLSYVNNVTSDIQTQLNLRTQLVFAGVANSYPSANTTAPISFNTVYGSNLTSGFEFIPNVGTVYFISVIGLIQVNTATPTSVIYITDAGENNLSGYCYPSVISNSGFYYLSFNLQCTILATNSFNYDYIAVQFTCSNTVTINNNYQLNLSIFQCN